MLKTETNTTAMEYRVRAAFAVSPQHDQESVESFGVVFEHGQWWIIATPEEGNERDEITYSVVDSTPGIDGFDFEEV